MGPEVAEQAGRTPLLVFSFQAFVKDVSGLVAPDVKERVLPLLSLVEKQVELAPPDHCDV